MKLAVSLDLAATIKQGCTSSTFSSRGMVASDWPTSLALMCSPMMLIGAAPDLLHHGVSQEGSSGDILGC